MIAHYFLHNFSSFAYKRFYTRGLLIQKLDEFIEVLCTNFLEYYPEEIQKNIRWDYDIINLFTGIVKSYDQLARKLLTTTIKFVLSSKSTINSEKINVFDHLAQPSDDFFKKSVENKQKTPKKNAVREDSTNKKERSFSPVLNQINRGFDEIFNKYITSKSKSNSKDQGSPRQQKSNMDSEFVKSNFDIKVSRKSRDENSNHLHAYVETSYRTPSPNKTRQHAK